MNDRLRQILVVIFAVLPVITAFIWGGGSDDLANTGDTVYFNPADYAFSIWSVLYLGIIAYGIYQALPSQTERTIHRRIGGWFIAASALIALWVPVATAGDDDGFAKLMTVFIIIGAVAMLSQVFTRIRNTELTDTDRWLVQVPMYALFAWLTVANLANYSTYLNDIDVLNGDANIVWAIAMLLIGTAVAVYCIFYTYANQGTIAYAAVIVWAFVAIYVANTDASMLVGTTAMLAALVVAGVTVYHFNSFERPRTLNTMPR